MEAIEHIIKLDRAQVIEEMDAEMMAAHEAVNKLHLEKLRELETKLAHRLGSESRQAANVGYRDETNMESLEEIPRPRRMIRDEPQA